MIDLSIIIINRNTRQMLLDCIASLYQTVRNANFEIFVVDNASSDGSVEAIQQAFPSVAVIANRTNEGFARANNRALRLMQGRYAVLLNSDTLMKDEALEKLLTFMDSRPDAGMCGPQLLNVDGSDQTSYGNFPTVLGEFSSKTLIRILAPRMYRNLYKPAHTEQDEPLPVDFIIGACMVARREAIVRVGMLDEDYFFFYEEIDWCRRMGNAGWLVYHVPDAEIYHFGGGSTREVSLRARAESWRSRYLFFKKSLGLGPVGMGLLHAAGFLQVLYRFLGYASMNILTVFLLRRLRNRLKIFGYLVLWHLRGFPLDMCLPRGNH